MPMITQSESLMPNTSSTSFDPLPGHDPARPYNGVDNRRLNSWRRNSGLARFWHALWIAVLQLLLLLPSTAQASVILTDNFDGTSLQGAYWTIRGPGAISVIGGIANFACRGYAD